MRNIALTIQFDGTAYHGWQRQNNAFSVQQAIESALSRITGAPVTVTGCGRTDAGVHALRYVCNFLTEARMPAERFAPALNSVLPCDIRCLAAADVPKSFHARFSAIGKRYRYLIDHAPVGDVFLRDRAWQYRYPLDFAQMQRACDAFIGKHDFAAFCASGSEVSNTVREIYSLTLERQGSLILMEVYGNGFLYNMVRIIAGTLVWVGSGKICAEQIAEIIDKRDRKLAGITAPPQGLYLQEVLYPERML